MQVSLAIQLLDDHVQIILIALVVLQFQGEQRDKASFLGSSVEA